MTSHLSDLTRLASRAAQLPSPHVSLASSPTHYLSLAVSAKLRICQPQLSPNVQPIPHSHFQTSHLSFRGFLHLPICPSQSLPTPPSCPTHPMAPLHMAHSTQLSHSSYVPSSHGPLHPAVPLILWPLSHVPLHPPVPLILSHGPLHPCPTHPMVPFTRPTPPSCPTHPMAPFTRPTPPSCPTHPMVPFTRPTPPSCPTHPMAPFTRPTPPSCPTHPMAPFTRPTPPSCPTHPMVPFTRPTPPSCPTHPMTPFTWPTPPLSQLHPPVPLILWSLSHGPLHPAVPLILWPLSHGPLHPAVPLILWPLFTRPTPPSFPTHPVHFTRPTQLSHPMAPFTRPTPPSCPTHPMAPLHTAHSTQLSHSSYGPSSHGPLHPAVPLILWSHHPMVHFTRPTPPSCPTHPMAPFTRPTPPSCPTHSMVPLHTVHSRSAGDLRQAERLPKPFPLLEQQLGIVDGLGGRERRLSRVRLAGAVLSLLNGAHHDAAGRARAGPPTSETGAGRARRWRAPPSSPSRRVTDCQVSAGSATPGHLRLLQVTRASQSAGEPGQR